MHKMNRTVTPIKRTASMMEKEEEDVKPQVDPLLLLKPPEKACRFLHLKGSTEALNCMKKFLVKNLMEGNLDLNAMISLSNTVFQTLQFDDDSRTKENAAFYDAVREFISSYRKQDELFRMKSTFEKRQKLLGEKDEVNKEVSSLKNDISSANIRKYSLKNRIEILMSKVCELEKELGDQESAIATAEGRIAQCEARMVEIERELVGSALDSKMALEGKEDYARRRAQLLPAIGKATSRLRSLVSP